MLVSTNYRKFVPHLKTWRLYTIPAPIFPKPLGKSGPAGHDLHDDPFYNALHLAVCPELQLKAVHIETFGKTGCRRIVPGQYLAADPQGRAIMISAVEKQKLVGSCTKILQYLVLYCSKVEDLLQTRSERNADLALSSRKEHHMMLHRLRNAIPCPCGALFVAQVYVLNRDTASRLAISSPLEAHKSHAVIFHTCGVDVGFDNPIFAVSDMCRV